MQKYTESEICKKKNVKTTKTNHPVKYIPKYTKSNNFSNQTHNDDGVHENGDGDYVGDDNGDDDGDDDGDDGGEYLEVF